MEKKPLELDFCLLIPCYNNKAGLLYSLSSVSYHADLFLIVIADDGSKEPLEAEDIQKEIAVKLPLVVVRIESNKGITNALNTGLDWIEKNQPTKYIARLDCDDRCDPERFYFQVAHMNSHPEIGLAGSWCLFEEENGKTSYTYKTPELHKEIYRSMYFRNVFIHPTVIFKKSLITQLGGYPTEFELAEDYALFWKMIGVSQTFVTSKILVTCRINRQGISYKNKRKQLAARQKVVNNFGKNVILKVVAGMRLTILFFIPKRLLLRLKDLRG
ncbi:MAG: glycosyltransferase [Chitinophagaceae bacterium]